VNLLLGSARGIYHLHSQNVIHRDIAARNILLTSSLEPKVSDFGMSRLVSSSRQSEHTASTVGPLFWMSPEALETREYSEKSDSYAFGILIWEVLSRKTPYDNFTNLSNVAIATRVMTADLRPTIPEYADPNLVKIMTDCWQKDPKLRPDFKAIVKILSTVTQEAEETESTGIQIYEKTPNHYQMLKVENST